LTKVTPKLLNRIVSKYNNPELNKRFEAIRKIRVDNYRANNNNNLPKLQRSAVRVLGNMKKEPIFTSDAYNTASPSAKGLIRFLRKKTGTAVVPSDYSYSRLVSANNIPEGLTPKQVKGIKSGKITKIIGLKENVPEEVILHEAGHNISRTVPRSFNFRMNNVYKYYKPNTGDPLKDAAETLNVDKQLSLIKGNSGYKKLVSDIGNVAEENLASAYSLDRLKNSPNLALRKKNLDNAIGSYVRDLKQSEMERAAFRPVTIW